MLVRAISPDLQALARLEINEDPSKIDEYIKEIRHWIDKQPHLNIRTDDQLLLTFLRGCKFNLERTKQKLKVIYTMKALNPELFGSRDVFCPSIQYMLDLGLCFPLPKTLNYAGPVVLYVRHKDVDTNKIHIMDYTKFCFMTVDIILNEYDNASIAGVRAIDDLNGIPIRHLVQLNPNNCKKVFTAIISGYPVRTKGMHFFHMPYYFDALFKLIKPFMPAKLRQRLKMYDIKNFNDLYNDIPRSVLPQELGGDDVSVEEMAAKWKIKVESYSEWFLNDVPTRPDESKGLVTKSLMSSLWNKLHLYSSVETIRK